MIIASSHRNSLDSVLQWLQDEELAVRAKDLLCLFIVLDKCTVEDVEKADLGNRHFSEHIRFFAELRNEVLRV